MPRKKRGIKRLPPCDSPWLVVWWVLFLVVLIAALVRIAVDAAMGDALYLYRNRDGEPESVELPVIEHLRSPAGAGANGATKEGHEEDYEGRDRARFPDFLYAPLGDADYSPPPRVVEFYAPWCPHCKHYAPKYIELASEVTATHPDVKFYAVSCVAHKELCKAQDVTSYPTVKYFKKGSYNSTTGTKQKANKILKELGLEAGESKQTHHDRGGIHHKSSKDDKEFARVIPFRRHDVQDAWADASLSFEFALQNGIYMENGPLPPAKASALREWLALLSRSLPHQMGRTLNIVDALLDHFDEAASGQSQLNALVGVHVPSKPSWSWRTCTYGDNGMGYTCGLWQLFHVMSVGVVEYNRHNPPIATGQVAETLRNYIEHFFQCDVCRVHFLSMYDTCAFDRCHRLSESSSSSEHEWRELPLWLWETHNDVNVRLLGERLEQNKLEKPSEWESQQVRWPLLFSCPNCWREDHSWDEAEVFDHLHGLYWSGSPSYIKLASDGADVGGDAPRTSTLRWKLSGVVFVVVVLLMRLSSAKNGKRRSGRHKRSSPRSVSKNWARYRP